MSTQSNSTATAASESDAYPLSEASIESFRRNGFVKVSGLLGAEEVARYRDQALSLNEAFVRERSEAQGKRNAIFNQLVNVWTRDATMKELTLHPRIAGAAKRLAGIDLRLWHDQTLVKEAGGKPTEWHQDQPYWPHANSTHPISCWIALVDVPADRGCMSFIPGAQRRTDLPMQILSDRRSLFSKAPELEYEPKVTVPLRAGDATFHHGRCPHMANANLTEETRVAHVVIYIDRTTTFTGGNHAVTKNLGLKEGQLIEGVLFPEV